MKKVFASLSIAVLALGSASAFATVYKCDLLKNAAGETLLGGPTYSVDLSKTGAVLQVVTGADEGGPLATVEFDMTKTSQEPDGAVYEVNGITASVVVTPFGGKVHTLVSISQKSGKETFTASCQ